MNLGPCVTYISLPLPLNDKLKRAVSCLTLPDNLVGAHPMRQEKFLAGRYCAKLALEQAGLTSVPHISITTDGSPQWPKGWIGSITHTEGFVAAAVAKSSDLLGLGIDSEPLMNQKTHTNVARRILTEKERTSLRPSEWSEIQWSTMVFSAKESIYKCLRPLCGNYFGFEDAEMDEINISEGRFSFHLTKDIGGAFSKNWTGHGRFEFNENFVHTAMELQI